jgi:thioredoxin 1
MAIKHVTEADFEAQVLNADSPVLVDFWAEWCGPCKMIAPILEEVAKDYAGKLQIAKIDVDANQGVPSKYGVRGIPTLMLFKIAVNCFSRQPPLSNPGFQKLTKPIQYT